MTTPISTPSAPDEYQSPKTGGKRKQEPTGPAKRAKKAAEDALKAAPAQENKRVTRSMSRQAAKPADSSKALKLGGKRGAGEDMTVSSPKVKRVSFPSTTRELFQLSYEDQKSLLEHLPKNVDPDSVQAFVDSLNDRELPEYIDRHLSLLEEVFTKTDHQAGLDKIKAAWVKKKQITNTKLIHREIHEFRPNLEKIRALCREGADLSGRPLLYDHQEMNVLKVAIISHKFDVAKILIEAGADVNMADSDGRTALHIAIRSHDIPVLGLLLNSGANIQKTDIYGRTPLHIAADDDNSQALATLYASGADIYAKDKRGRAALDCMSSEFIISTIVEDPRTVLDDRFFNATIGPVRSYAFIQTGVSHIGRSPHPANLQKFLEMLAIERESELWDPHLDQRGRLSEGIFRFSPDPDSPDFFWVRTPQASGSIPKTRFYEIIVDQITQDRIKDQINQFFGIIPRVLVGTYELTLHPDEFREHPEKILETLNEKFTKEKASSLRITFIGEEGVDAGGLRRQFIDRLVSEICLKMKFERCENRLYRPILQESSDGKYIPLTDAEKATYRQFGNLIMFCLNASESYPTGMVLDQGVLDAVRSMQKEKYSFDEHFSIFERLASYNAADTALCKRFKRYLALADDATLQEVAAAIESDMDIATMKKHLPEVKASLLKYIQDNTLVPKLAPIHEIAVGMNASPFQEKLSFAEVQGMHPAELSKRLQGTVSKEDIIARLKFAASTPENVRNFLINWIQKADDEKFALFLFALSGSSALGDDVDIVIENGSAIGFHTCGFQLDLDYENIKTESELADRLDTALEIIKENPLFDVA